MSREIFDSDLKCPLCVTNIVEHDSKRYIHREHIPPRSIFVNGTTDLITVPSCKECNNGTSKLDLEFKIAMGLYLGTDVPDFWKSTVVSLNKTPIRQAIKRTILDGMSKILIPYANGKYGYKVKLSRKPIQVVVKKIVQCLYWHLKNQTLPSDTDWTIVFLRQGENAPQWAQDILDRYGKTGQVGRGAFEYQYGVADEDSAATVWKLRFYDVDSFIIISLPKE